MCRYRHQAGATLVELMVGLVIGLFILSGVLFINQQQTEVTILQASNTRLLQQARDVMERITRDLRRAGYQGYQHHVSSSTISVDNPFANRNASLYGGYITDITIANQTSPNTEAASSCIRYTYNLDDDYPTLVGSGTTSYGSDFDTDNLEMFGFKLSSSAVMMRTGSGGSTQFDCNNGSWEPVSDTSQITITGLTFTLSTISCTNFTAASRNDCDNTVTPSSTTDNPQSGDVLVRVREIEVELSGQAPSATDLTVTLNQKVSLKNDLVYAEP